jgi:hypothetical protein
MDRVRDPQARNVLVDPDDVPALFEKNAGARTGADSDLQHLASRWRQGISQSICHPRVMPVAYELRGGFAPRVRVLLSLSCQELDRRGRARFFAALLFFPAFRQLESASFSAGHWSYNGAP